MKIVYLHQYYRTPSDLGSAGMRSYEFSNRLAAKGHTVDVVTSRMDVSAGQGQWEVTQEAGANVHWISVPYSNEMSSLQRIGSFLKFAVLSSFRAIKLAKNADVIIATSTPLTIAVPAVIASWVRRVPVVFEVRDLWPDAAIQTGFLQGAVPIWLARQLERFAYANATRIIALSPGMEAGVVSVSKKHTGQVTMIPNCSDLDRFGVESVPHAIEAMNPFQDKFVCSYFGTLGYANDLGFMVEVAKELKRRGDEQLVLYLVGQGREREMLELAITENELTNLVVDGPYPPAMVPEIARRSDVCLTLFRDLPVLHTCSPNKFFDSLAAGKPVLTNMTGWIAELVEAHQCGTAIVPGDVSSFADRLIELKNDPTLVSEMGKNARALAESQFSRDAMFAKFEQVLKEAAKV